MCGEYLATVRCTMEAFRTQNLCVWEGRGCREKNTEGKENPSEIERHVTQQRKSRQVYTEGGRRGAQKERERTNEKRAV